MRIRVLQGKDTSEEIPDEVLMVGHEPIPEQLSEVKSDTRIAEPDTVSLKEDNENVEDIPPPPTTEAIVALSTAEEDVSQPVPTDGDVVPPAATEGDVPPTSTIEGDDSPPTATEEDLPPPPTTGQDVPPPLTSEEGVPPLSREVQAETDSEEAKKESGVDSKGLLTLFVVQMHLNR